MSGSIRDLPTYLAADAFRPHPFPIPPEELVLERYTFLSFVRTGIAASLARPFAWNAPVRARVKLSVPVVADAGTKPAEVEVIVRGPGDVKAIDARQVIRCYPNPGTPDALTEELAHVEFDRPDFPWLFTPTGPAGRQLVPWLTLVVIPRLPGEPEPLRPGERGKLPTLQTTRGELPALSDAWAWAHAQVMGGAADPHGIPERLSPANPAINLARLLCPRHLEANTSFVACVVPTFLAGLEAGLGLPPKTTDLAPSWNDGDPPAKEVTLPVYFSWTFSTGLAEDFKALAERIEPLPAPPGLGRRRVDTSHPGNGIPDVAAGAGREMVIDGPIVSLQQGTKAEGWPEEADQRWPNAQHDELRRRLNVQQKQQLSDGVPVEPPTVGPPLYAGAHARRTSIDDGSPGWFKELNDDPRSRVVAGVGARVVQHDQEALMAEAWNQVAGVEAANAALRFAQLGRYVGESIHRRHVKTLPPAALLALTHGVHGKILDTPAVTVRARLTVSSLPVTVTSGAFRRLVRPRGPVARFAAPGLVDRPAAVAALVADAAGQTRSYVRPYRNPDGIDALSSLSRSLVTPELAARVFPAAANPIAELDRRAALLAKPSLTDALTGPALEEFNPDWRLEPETGGAAVLEQLLLAIPSLDLVERNRDAAEVARTLASQLAAVAETGETWLLPAHVVDHVRIESRPVRESTLDPQFTDWVSTDEDPEGRQRANGILRGKTVSISGFMVAPPPGSTLDGTGAWFADPFFSPPLPQSDAIEFFGDVGSEYVLTFGAPTRDPILHIASLASRLDFPAGTQITRLSGEDDFTVSDNTVTGKLDGSKDRSGTVRLSGVFKSISFTATRTYDGTSPDGIMLQVGEVPVSTVRVVGKPELENLGARLRDLTSHHELGEHFDDRATAQLLKQKLVEWQAPPEHGLKADLVDLGKRLVSPGGAVDIDRDPLPVPDLGLAAKLHPRITVTNRVLGRLTTRPGWLRADWFDDRRIEPVMVAPRFDHPMYEALDRYDRNWLVPGIGLIKEPDLATLLATNARFVEAFLVGLNHEFARELLWREYPTDGRATCFRSFWTHRVELVQDLHTFDDELALGHHVDKTLDDRIVLLARGELIRRYPGLVAHAVMQAELVDGRPVFALEPAKTLFQINLAPNLLLVGFDVKAADVENADPDPDKPLAEGAHPWFFTLAENPTEPRFGLDDGPRSAAHERDDLTWVDLVQDGSRFLRPSLPAPPPDVKDGPFQPTPAPAATVRWGVDAAAVAHILYQPPARAAFRAASMIKKAKPGP